MYLGRDSNLGVPHLMIAIQKNSSLKIGGCQMTVLQNILYFFNSWGCGGRMMLHRQKQLYAQNNWVQKDPSDCLLKCRIMLRRQKPLYREQSGAKSPIWLSIKMLGFFLFRSFKGWVRCSFLNSAVVGWYNVGQNSLARGTIGCKQAHRLFIIIIEKITPDLFFQGTKKIPNLLI